jgi:hypothetical protein
MVAGNALRSAGAVVYRVVRMLVARQLRSQNVAMLMLIRAVRKP